jgi:hypothetical protein
VTKGRKERRALLISRFVLLLAIFAGSGCAAVPHPYAILPGHEGGGAGQRLVVLPLNVVVSMPGELQKPSKSVADLTSRYLQESGNTVETLSFYDARSRWLAAVRTVQAAGGSDQDFNAAGRVFVEQLAQEKEFDAVVMPNLVYRTADIYSGSSTVSWDGVKRDMEVVNQAQMKGSIHLMGNFFGSIDAVSLHVFIFDAGGERFFESYGGLDLVHLADVAGAEDEYRWQMRLKSDPLADEGALREGIELAFDPYVEKREQPRASRRCPASPRWRRSSGWSAPAARLPAASGSPPTVGSKSASGTSPWSATRRTTSCGSSRASSDSSIGWSSASRRRRRPAAACPFASTCSPPPPMPGASRERPTGSWCRHSPATSQS